MPTCRKCNIKFPNKIKVEGREVNAQRRKFCLMCSPYGKHNTRATLNACELPNKKKCPCCKEVKNNKEFHKKRSKLTSYCKSCLYAYQAIRWNIKKKEAVEYLGGKCHQCGIRNIHPILFDFHHYDPSSKEHDWTTLRLRSKENMLKELNKCHLLCVFCHRLKHINVKLWKKAYDKIGQPYLW